MTKAILISLVLLALLIPAIYVSLAQETRPESQPLSVVETQPMEIPLPAETQPAPALPPQNPNIISVMPDFQGIDQWFNSTPLTKASLKGKVVLVDFWTYSCVNCLRTLPYLKEWHKKYKTKGLVIIGVHSAEFEFERDPANVKAAIDKFQIPYPVALDNKMATWLAFKNTAWPAHYLIDGEGRVRHIHLGEGDYENSEAIIQKLLMEKSFKKAPVETQPAESRPTESQPAAKAKSGRGKKGCSAAKPCAQEMVPAEAPLVLPGLTFLPPNVDFAQIKSPETYLGFLRRERLVTSGRPIELNEWSYDGKWRTEGERIFLVEGTGKIAFRFSATKVNIVLTPGGAPISTVVRLDGQPVPKEKAGKDVQGSGILITEPRMYELINLGPKGETHTIEIEFLNPGVGAYAFTFG